MRKITWIPTLLLATTFSLSAQMLFDDIEKEIHSPYASGITPSYDTTVDGSRSPKDPVVEADPLTNIKTLADALLPEDKVDGKYTVEGEMNKETVDTTGEEMTVSGALAPKAVEPVVAETPALPAPASTPAKPAEKVLTAEVRPSSEIKYPDQNFVPAQPAKSGSSSIAVASANPSSAGSSIASRTLPNSGKKWFIVMKASNSEESLEADRVKVQGLFKSVPVKIHEESGYHFLMAGPAGQDSIGIMMKLVKFNGYPEAATVIAR